jgi:transitional endoplasmic reticulum ATPase
MSEETIQNLREALKGSPDNVAIRQMLADALCGVGRYEEAEKEYGTALALSPDNEKLKLGLATSFYQNGKYTQCLVIVETFIGRSSPPAKALILHSRLLLNDGETEKAVRQYKRAISEDPSVGDPLLAERLGIDASAQAAQIMDGKVRDRVGAPSGDEPADPSDFTGYVERADIKFEDVGGMDQVKEQIKMKIIYPLTNPDMFKAYGKKIGGGILMYGPPGCGKTYLARATAGEINAGFLCIGINDVLDMWIGSSERNLHELFEQGRRNKPCVMFFDEVDALAASRSDLKHSGVKHTINQFLMELDGVNTDNDGLLVLAATNAPWHLDSAFRRPGRFDRIIFVPPPDAPARAGILRIMLKGKPLESIDYEYLAKKTDKYSGADLKAIVDYAVEQKIEQAMRDGQPKPVTTKDLEAAMKEVKPSTIEWFATARNYALYSNQGGAYDDILKYLKL